VDIQAIPRHLPFYPRLAYRADVMALRGGIS
jgi:hypothetical protein